MRLKMVGIAMFVASMLVMNTTAAGREPPLAKLVQVVGGVEYSRNGSTWRPVRRTKYLFSGYTVKTSKDGGGKLINQQTGLTQVLGANSEIRVGKTEVELITGSLSKPKQESGSIFQGLANKFAKAQKYTTVRRSVSRPGDDLVCDNKVRTIRDLALSSFSPDLVWRNACPEFSYRLLIDGEVFKVAAKSNSEMIRYTVSGITEGEHIYRVEVLDKDGTVYIPRKDSKFVWISDEESRKIQVDIEDLQDDVFLVTDYLESKKLYVAAMDAYRAYFAENSDDNDMRPLLITSYHDLKLTDLQKNEARLYTASLEEDF